MPENYTDNNDNERSGRGFAGMDPDKQREIASKGGKAAHESGNANEFDSNTGREAGRKGGQSGQGRSGAQSEQGRAM